MKVYVTTDTHFGHKALWEKHNRHQGFEMDELEALAGVSGDLFIHMGDFAWKQVPIWTEQFMTAAQGFKHKILIRGNHDYESNSWYLNHGWDAVMDAMEIKLFSKKLLFTHIPRPKEDRFDHNIHGHLHGVAGRHRWDEHEHMMVPGYHIDVAPDDNQYRPYDLEELLGDCGRQISVV